MSTNSISAVREDLWEKALATLDDDLRAMLNIRRPGRPDLIHSLLETVSERRKQSVTNRWRFKNSRGQEIVLRNIFEKIAGWANRFRAVGDVAAQYDAVHAALPWAGVRFLLQIAVSDIQIYGALVDSLEAISNYITRSAVFEKICLREASPATSELQKALVGLNAKVLTFLAKAIGLFESARFRGYHLHLGPIQAVH